MLTVPAGTPLIEAIVLASQANIPVLLVEGHGIGKSQLFEQAAAHLGIGHISRDLSLMEPPDLVGMPRVGKEGSTRYAIPSWLPQAGRGLLVFEELNRCPRYMQAPCFQLLTARELNDYRLPEGWLPCAAINDAADGYVVDELDAALLARFMRVKVVPDVQEWATWARVNQVHPKIVEFVEQSPGVFEDAAANPRAWTYASQLLTAWEHGERQRPLLRTVLAGVLGEKWALAFIQVYRQERQPLRPEEVIEAYPAHRAAVQRWTRQGHLDVVASSLEWLKRHLQAQPVYEAVLHEVAHKANVEAFFADLPAELQRQVREWLEDRGFHQLSVPPRSRSVHP